MVWTLDLGGIVVSPLIDIESMDFAIDDLLPDAGRADEPVSLRFQGFLVRAAGSSIIVDTGVGRDKVRPGRPGWHRRTSDRFLADLADHGLAPADIDTVIATHLHADHIGWHTRLVDGVLAPTFPRARHLFVDQELAYWQRKYAEDAAVNYGSFTDSIVPVLRDARCTVVGDRYEVVPGVVIEVRDGHTPGTSVVTLTGSGASAIICGDVIHHPLQLARPEWGSRFCVSSSRSYQVRKALIDEACQSGAVVLPAHWTTGPVRLRRDRGAVRAVAVTR